MSQQEATVPQFQLHHRLSLAMEAQGVSVAEMATVIGYSVKQTGNYLHGRQMPREGTIRAWAMRCGVPYPWLRDGIEPENGPDNDGMGSDLGVTGSGCISDTPGGADVVPMRRHVGQPAKRAA